MRRLTKNNSYVQQKYFSVPAESPQGLGNTQVFLLLLSFNNILPHQVRCERLGENVHPTLQTSHNGAFTILSTTTNSILKHLVAAAWRIQRSNLAYRQAGWIRLAFLPTFGAMPKVRSQNPSKNQSNKYQNINQSQQATQQSQNLHRYSIASSFITPSIKKSIMALIIKSKKHLYIRVPIILLLILLFAISPVLIGIIGAQTTNQPCHEGNCFWGAFGWYFLLTMPIAGVLFIIFLVIVIADVSKLSQK
ncbi:MAG: hypothetical protein SFU99_03130 [Saprospiraceae bacterium]|nr:hypothetical protein [Saprospiraceae bacterium]